MIVIEPKLVDFVVVLEATANMVSHWDGIKSNYILPALEYFNGKAATAMDCIGNNGNSHYGYVLFRSGDASLEPMTTSAVIQSPSLFVRKLESIVFSGGGSEKYCLVAEGLGRALKVFDDIASKRPQRDSTKICILICSSPPYSMPCADTHEHTGRNYEELAKLMGSRDIHLSVMSPLHIKQMKDIYQAANQPKFPIMNYAQDQRHLVLISGFDLPADQTLVKAERKGELGVPSSRSVSAASSVSSPSMPQPVNAPSPYNQKSSTSMFPGVSISSTFPPTSSLPRPAIKQEQPSSVNTTLQSSTIFTAPTTQENTSNTGKMLMNNFTTVSGGNKGSSIYTSINDTAVKNQNPINTLQQNSLFNNSSKDIQDNSSTQYPATMGAASSSFTSPNNQPNSGMSQIPVPNFSGQPKPHPAVLGGMSQPPSNIAALSTAKTILEEAKQQSSRPIWTGLLEWNEKRAVLNGEERTTHHLNCEVLMSRNNQSEENLAANLWPKTLNMQLVPRIVLSNDVIRQFLRKIPMVTLKLSPHDQSVHLCNLMSQRWMGVININISPAGVQPVDGRVILVIHSSKNGQVVGLVSREAGPLINAIKQTLKPRAIQPQTQPSMQDPNFPAGRRIPNGASQRHNVPGRMLGNEVPMNGLMTNQPRQEFSTPTQMNNPNMISHPQNIIGQQNPIAQPHRYQSRPRHPQPHPRMRAIHQQSQPRQQLPIIQTTGDGLRTLLAPVGGNNMNQTMSQQQRPEILSNHGMGQAGFMSNQQQQQIRHQMNSHVMNMSQQRFGMQ